jgi:hypothetical protein
LRAASPRFDATMIVVSAIIGSGIFIQGVLAALFALSGSYDRLLMGTAILLAGVPAFYVWKALRRREAGSAPA